MAERPDFAAYQDALPILGVDGTLAHSVKPDSPVRGKVQAKTGTYIGGSLLDGSYLLFSKALAGYMTARSGRKLAFALFLNRVPLPTIPELLRQGEVLGSVCEVIYRNF
jgi:D-alanyl-D-alanine carboxypeptidase/D-alanyl-D-alanine-endopeptidase (penicillin-binding protein 4)